jgi:hypothetical protein
MKKSRDQVAKENRMRVALRMIAGMSLCAAALIASSWLLKGNPAGEWVDAGLYLVTGCFFASQVILAFPQLFLPHRTDGGNA